jgi:hypothetical protein
VKGLINPVTDLLGGEEASGGDLGLEAFDLDRSEFAGSALIVERVESFQTPGAKEMKPLADLPLRDTEEVGDLVLGPALDHPQDSGGALSDALVASLTAAAFNPLADQRSQCQCQSSLQNSMIGGPTSEDNGVRSGDCRTFPFAETIYRGVEGVPASASPPAGSVPDPRW